MKITIEVKYGINTEWSVEFINFKGSLIRYAGNIELTEERASDSVRDVANLLEKAHDLAQDMLDVQKSIDILEGDTLP